MLHLYLCFVPILICLFCIGAAGTVCQNIMFLSQSPICYQSEIDSLPVNTDTKLHIKRGTP